MFISTDSAVWYFVIYLGTDIDMNVLRVQLKLNNELVVQCGLIIGTSRVNVYSGCMCTQGAV